MSPGPPGDMDFKPVPRWWTEGVGDRTWKSTQGLRGGEST